MSIGGAMLGSAQGEIRIDVDEARRNVEMLQRTLGDFDQASGRIGQNVGAAGGFLAGLGAIAVGGIGGAVNVAADFEAQMSAVGAVTNATTQELAALEETAMRLGAETSFSASEAAGAIEELGKAGVSTEDILNGAADGAVNLAAAAGIGVPQAAILMANALNIFGLAGEDATHVADLFAAAANTSAADADGLGQSLSQVGTIAAGFNISLEDTVGLLALLADNGLKGSDAGTALKTALSSMLTPVGTGADEIERLGLNFRDANGEFIGFGAAADELRAKLEPLSVAQRDAALTAIFGSDAIRVGRILYGESSAEIERYTQNVNDAGAAQEAASKRLDNFSGSLEQLRGSLETAGIVIGSVFLPFLRELVDAGTSVINAFLDMPSTFQAIAAVGTAVAGIVSLLAGGFLLLLPRIVATIQGFKELKVLLAGLSLPVAPFLAIVAALAALGIAYKTNLFGFADAVNSVFGTIRDAASGIAAAMGPVIDVLGFLAGARMGDGGKFLEGQGIALANFEVALRAAGLSSNSARVLRDALSDLAKPVRQLRNTFVIGGRALKNFTDIISGHQLSTKELEKFQKRLTVLFGASAGASILKGTQRLRTAISGFGDALKESVGVDLGAFFSLSGVVGLLTDGFTGFVNLLRRDIIPVFGVGLGAAINGMATGLDFIAEHIDTVVQGVGFLANAIATNLRNALNVASALLSGDFSGALDAVGQLITDAFDQAVDIGNVAISIGGWLVEQAVNLGGAVVSFVAGEWATIKETGITLVGYAVRLGQWAIGMATDLGVAVVDFLVGAWPAVKNAGVDLVGYTVRLGQWLISTGSDLGASVVNFLIGLWPAIKDTGADLVGFSVRLGQWSITEAGSLASDVINFLIGLWPAIKDTGADLVGYVVRLSDWLAEEGTVGGLVSAIKAKVDEILTVSIPAAVNLALSLGNGTTTTGMGSAISKAVVDSISTLTTLGGEVAGAINDKITTIQWGSFITADSFHFGESLGAAVRGAIASSASFAADVAGGIVDAIRKAEISADDVGEVAGKVIDAIAFAFVVLPVGAATAVMSALAGFFKGLVFGDGSFDMSSTAEAVGSALIKGIKALPGIGVDIVTGVATAISGAVDGSTLLNAAASIGSALKDALIGWVQAHLNPGDLLDGIFGGDGDPNDGNPGQAPPGGAAGSTRPVPFTSNPGALMPKVGFDPADLAGIQTFVDVMGTASNAVKSFPKAQLDQIFNGINTSAFDTKIASVTDKLREFAATRSRTILDGDTGPFAVAYTEVSTWGKALEDATFSATFDADNGPAAVAYTEAFGWGDTWDGTTFTASLSIDLSALDAAKAKVDETVAYIANRLPHSPAKEGPLSRPISFAYIAEDLIDQMERMQPAADRGLSGLASRLRESLPAIQMPDMVSGLLAALSTSTIPTLSLANMPMASAPSVFHQQTVVINTLTPESYAEIIQGARGGLGWMDFSEQLPTAYQTVTGRR